MWSGPRNISTAMMRAWENRDDCHVVDEPFYACYLHATGIRHPMYEAVLASQPREWHAVIVALTAPLPEGVAIQYQKHMTHHMVAGLDEDWLRTARHAFLIRDPIEMVASYARKREAVGIDDLGLPQQVQIYHRIADVTGTPPPVLESRDVLHDPATMLRRLCTALHVAFCDRMLSWPPGLRASDGVWAPHWYDAVAKSTGFGRFDAGPVVLPRELRDVAEACRPYYEFFCERKLQRA